MHLDPERSDFLGYLRAPGFGNGNKQRAASVRFRVFAALPTIQVAGRQVANGPRGFRERSHQHEHAPHVRVMGNAAFRLARWHALDALAGKDNGLL